MKLLNKVFSGVPSDKTPAKELPLHNMLNLKDDLDLIPLDEIAVGEQKLTDKAGSLVTPEDKKLDDNSLENELAYLEKYERLQNKIDTSELYDIFSTLETISTSINEMNQNKEIIYFAVIRIKVIKLKKIFENFHKNSSEMRQLSISKYKHFFKFTKEVNLVLNISLL